MNIWLGIGFGIIPFFVLFLGYLNVHPELYLSAASDFKKENYSPSYSIAWGEDEKDDPPLKYINDSYKGINVWTEVVEVKSFWSLWNSPSSELEYTWEYKVKNISDKKRSIKVTYKLVDKMENVLDSSVSSGVAEPDETITIQGKSRMDYNILSFVDGSNWSIGNYKVFN